ncbi:Hypothetical protein, putative [Bodo saltans]|uniref:Uncharacterized protein n=1 Tax=Bodo saltans TaxID=75058 RepID=A0A0S4INP5_BODSA|nr:Hypothetical protein, putative [Bodo saltans]|eukprot:CUE89370.1 Hypothetical protein, putative [Bodo saltans]
MELVRSTMLQWLQEHRQHRRAVHVNPEPAAPLWRPQATQLSEVRSCFLNCFTRRNAPPNRRFLHNVPTILVSSCLLGHPVAYHGRSSQATRKKNISDGSSEVSQKPRTNPQRSVNDFTFLVHTLSDPSIGVVKIIPLCPEVDVMGLPVPRPPIRLIGRSVGSDRQAGAARKRSYRHVYLQDPVRGAVDVSSSLLGDEAAHRSIDDILDPRAQQHGLGGGARPPAPPLTLESFTASIDGAILKSKSPTCGVGDARVYLPQSLEQHVSGSGVPHSFSNDDGVFVQRYLRGAPSAQDGSQFPIVTERSLRPRTLYNRSLEDQERELPTDQTSTPAERFIDQMIESYFTK